MNAGDSSGGRTLQGPGARLEGVPVDPVRSRFSSECGRTEKLDLSNPMTTDREEGGAHTSELTVTHCKAGMYYFSVNHINDQPSVLTLHAAAGGGHSASFLEAARQPRRGGRSRARLAHALDHLSCACGRRLGAGSGALFVATKKGGS